MAPTSNIVLCRHAQAEHNVALDYTIHDAPLTPLGKRQVAQLADMIPELQGQVDLICTSPLKRTLQTTKLGWASAIKRLGIESVVCLPQAQECNALPCDTGSSRQVLEASEEFKGFNFELLTSDWTSKKGFYAADPTSLAKRGQWIRQFLRSRPEHTILLVAHGDILRQITATARGPGTHGWLNAEVRVFRFDNDTVDTEDCFLQQEADVAAAGGYGRNSSDIAAGNL